MAEQSIIVINGVTYQGPLNAVDDLLSMVNNHFTAVPVAEPAPSTPPIGETDKGIAEPPPIDPKVEPPAEPVPEPELIEPDSVVETVTIEDPVIGPKPIADDND